MNRLLTLILVATSLLSTAATENFTSHDVTVFNPKDSITLAGTVSAPEGTARAAIVLATGSGLQNRDEEIFGHRPFKVIGERLAEEGYVVLRMDDRGFGQSEGAELLANSTTTSFAGDILSGLNYLRQSYPGIPAGILGHSEGGEIAFRLASRPENNVDFIVTLAAPAWSGDSIVISQARRIATLFTGSWAGEDDQRVILEIVKMPIAAPMKQAMMLQVLSEELGDTYKLPAVRNSLFAQIEAMTSPYYIDMILYDPSDDIRAVQIPWLALNGDKDTQVLPENLQTLAELNPNVNTILLPGHNHLFQHAQTGLPQEYPQIPEDISDETLQAIIEWLDQSVNKTLSSR